MRLIGSRFFKLSLKLIKKTSKIIPHFRISHQEKSTTDHQQQYQLAKNCLQFRHVRACLRAPIPCHQYIDNIRGNDYSKFSIYYHGDHSIKTCKLPNKVQYHRYNFEPSVVQQWMMIAQKFYLRQTRVTHRIFL